MIKQAAERRCGPSVWRAFSPKRRKRKKEGGIYSHASHSKVVGLHVLNVKKNKICFLLFVVFFLFSRHALFFFVLVFFSPRTAATQHIWGLWTSLPVVRLWERHKARYLCSLAPGSTDYQGCLEIKTKCNYCGRELGGGGGRGIPPHV